MTQQAIKWNDIQITEIATMMFERLQKDQSRFTIVPSSADPHKLEKVIDNTAPVPIEFCYWSTNHYRIAVGAVLGVYERDWNKTPSEPILLLMKLRDSFENILKARVSEADMERLGNEAIFQAFPEIGDKLLK